MKRTLFVITAVALIAFFYLGRMSTTVSNNTDVIECIRFEPTDGVCEMCDALADGDYSPRYDYRIDIFNRGDGMVIMQDMATGQAYVVDADSITQTINTLNQ